ncbi:MAG TPA: L-seryl-tRNA(Sec) selenium transferase [Ktedonobacterales bacterium]|nr:L-seryl-tRNA(Sec) selenium transferase [Ktedonobacterales bacterium]
MTASRQSRTRAASPAADGRTAALRALPAVDTLLRAPQLVAALAAHPHAAVTHAARSALAAARVGLRAGAPPPAHDDLVAHALALLEHADRPALSRVLNATGVIVNTNLGRAPLSAAALAAITRVAGGYSNLEYELEPGARGSRHRLVADLLCELTGAEAALVVNNNAAAALVVLSALAAGREVIISRGELVEIGGGFRVPDVLRQSGARLVEVGTTNRTRLEDYAAAIGPETGLILLVHPSNYRIVGFTEAPERAQLAALARRHRLPLVEDLGSGCLLPTERWGLAHEPTPRESLAAGCNVVCFSGDKLLGGPQAGVIVGRQKLLERIARHPLMRATRVDKLTLAALEATLRAYRAGTAERDIPVWRMIALPAEAIRARAQAWVAHLHAQGIAAEVGAGSSTIGGGSLPGETLATTLCTVRAPRPELEIGTLAARLRTGEPALVARVSRERLLLDPRTIDPADDAALLDAVARAFQP